MGIATDLIYIVIAALVGGTVALVLRQPLICGYILAGLIVGPYTRGYSIQNVEAIEKLAEIGVALLLFTLGLEFSFGELRRLARITLLATPLQILLSSVIGYWVALGIGMDRNDALWIGAAISLSSTMVVLKTLASRDALESNEGRLMLAVLIAQDLAVVPLMLLLPQLTKDEIDFTAIVQAGLKSALFLMVMYVAGTRVLPRVFTAIANQGSRELFFLSTLGFALGAGYISHELELSFALGAFVAGMLLSETDFNHQALSDVANLRDLFAVIFFVSVGMLFDPQFLVSHFGTVVALVGAIVLVKTLVLSGLVVLFGYGASAAAIVGLGLSQVGEFAFVIVNTARQIGGISSEAYSLMISVAVVSMVMTPSLVTMGTSIARSLGRVALQSSPEGMTGGSRWDGHVIIIGAGVVGRYVARVLAALRRPYVVIESDYKIATQMRDLDVTVLFGDGSHRAILESAGLHHASLVVVTTTNDTILPTLIGEVKAVRSDIPIVVRVEEVEDVLTLSSLKVEEIVQPQLEVGLEMVRQSLLALHIDESQIIGVLGQLRADRYEPGRFLGGGNGAKEATRLLQASRFLELVWIEVTPASDFAGSSLLGSRLRERYGISVVGLMRGSDFLPTPPAETVLIQGDQLAVLGTRSQLKAIREGNLRI